MENRINQMEIAKVSSKGQLVIPKSFRKKFDIKQGNMFALASINKTLVLKKIENPIEDRDIQTIKLVEEAWDDIEKGRYKKLSKLDFLKELEEW